MSCLFLRLIPEVETGMGQTETVWKKHTMWPSRAVFFNLCTEAEPFATNLIAHQTLCDGSCISTIA